MQTPLLFYYLFVEVNHGPNIVDNNIFLSTQAINNQSGGGAYIHNLINGAVVFRPDLNRFTPYFLPHSINTKDLTTIFGGDDRIFNNLIVGDGKVESQYGMEGYNSTKLPVWIEDNVYYHHAKASTQDINPYKATSFNPELILEERNGSVYLHLTLSQNHSLKTGKLITTEKLGSVKIPKAPFDNPDGSPLVVDTDFF